MPSTKFAHACWLALVEKFPDLAPFPAQIAEEIIDREFVRAYSTARDRKMEAEFKESGLPEVLNTEAFRAAWRDWLLYRRQRHLASYAPVSRQAILIKLASFGHDGALISIHNSIAQQYMGLFEPRLGAASNRNAFFA